MTVRIVETQETCRRCGTDLLVHAQGAPAGLCPACGSKRAPGRETSCRLVGRK
jgi:predicted RNA-binding Zn-ribbon protein involved in translation (DUF1610 family)